MFLYNIIYVFESIKNSDDSLSIHLRYLELALITVRYRRNKFSDAKTLKKFANITRRKKNQKSNYSFACTNGTCFDVAQSRGDTKTFQSGKEVTLAVSKQQAMKAQAHQLDVNPILVYVIQESFTRHT